MTYTFGDTDIAGLRLKLLADVYESSSGEFLRSLKLMRPRLCIDLGCGPGYTTELVQQTLLPVRTIGIDQSEQFLERAVQRKTESMQFLRHDVTSMPLPVEPADLLYCRFLLTHLREPSHVLSGWLPFVTPTGVLALEELEHMHSAHPVLSEYYGIVEAMQDAHGQEMYIGKRLEVIARETPWQVVETRVARLSIPGKQMARLHHLNIQTWKQDPFIRKSYTREHIDELESQLGNLAQGDADVPDVDYGMRQIVCRRDGHHERP
jgi:trans-aconitate 2-methyltransferase